MIALVIAIILVLALVGGVGLVMVTYNRILLQRKRALGVWNILDRLRHDRHDRLRILVDIAWLSLPGADSVIQEIANHMQDAKSARGFDAIMQTETNVTIGIDNLRVWLDSHPAVRHVHEFEQAFYDVNLIEDNMVEQEMAYNDCVDVIRDLSEQRAGRWISTWFNFRPFPNFYCIEEPPAPPGTAPHADGQQAEMSQATPPDQQSPHG